MTANPSIEDPTVTDGIRSGDPDVLQSVVRQHLPILLRAARRSGLPIDRAEDAVQETMLTFLKRAPEFDGRARVRTWMFGILLKKIARGFEGTRSEPAQLDIGMRGLRGTFVEVKDGDPVDLEFPVQGGHVLFAGAQLRNMDPCRVELTGRLRHPATGEVVTEEKRNLDFTVDGGNGVLADMVDTANVSNIPVCPNFHDRDFVDTEWVLEVEAKDRAGRLASTQRRVIPSCRQSGPHARAACQCECRANYFFGRCTPDAGRPAGG